MTGVQTCALPISGNNICVVECGGKTNIHIFMRVLNKFRIPYIVIHDIDPLSFPNDKPDKTDKEKQKLRMFRENQFIENTLDNSIGKIIRINPELEDIIGVSKSKLIKKARLVQLTDRKSTRLELQSHSFISYAVFCLKKKKKKNTKKKKK